MTNPAQTGVTRMVMHVDTGTDDAAALIWAATSPEVELVAALTGWGNVDADQATRNTAGVLAAAGRPDIPVHPGLGRAHAGPSPTGFGADVVMGADGLNGVVVPAGAAVSSESAIDALLRLTAAEPGALTLVAVAPFTTIAAALAADPGLPARLGGVTLMAGSVGAGGNITAAAEANVGNDPDAAARVVETLGASGALAGGAVPRLVGLDVTLRATVDGGLVQLAARSSRPGAAVLHDIWRSSWEFGALETHHHGLPVHDLLAAWCAVHPDLCTWERMPLAVDTSGGAAWGMTVADRRVAVLDRAGLPAERHAELLSAIGAGPGRWDVAVGVDIAGFRSGLRAWLGG